MCIGHSYYNYRYMRVTIFRDYKEEEWESMEVYTNHLINGLLFQKKFNIEVNEYLGLEALSAKFPKSRNKYLRYAFRYFVNPPGAFFHQGDINHITDQANAHLLTILNPRKTVITCHDLIVPHWQMGHLADRNVKKRLKRIVELWRIHLLSKAARIIAVSDATKDDIVHTLQIRPEKIIVIPEGVSPVFRRTTEKATLNQTQGRYKLPRRFILHVGTNHEYKNIEGLLRMFAHVSSKDHNLYLVKAGQPWTMSQSLMIKQMHLAHKIIHCGFVPTNDLPAIYSLATALVQPSHTEGFGLTVLEAMACGCPVVLSRIPALIEIAGKAGIYIPMLPTGKDLGKALAILLKSRARTNYYRLGLTRSKFYSWDRAAQLTYKVYQEVCKEK